MSSALGTVSSALDNLPFPKSYLIIVVAAVVLAIIIAVSVATCSRPAADESQAPAEGQQQEQEQQSEVVQTNEDIPEDLRWRDTDFAVDPSKNTWSFADNGRKVVYLTVDDGPSELTEQYLDLFDKYNVKATFFVTGHDPQHYGMIHEAYKRGHTIGLHSMTHQYDQIYASEEAFLKDLDDVGQVVKDQIGYVPYLTRFPGGSSNTQAEDYSKGLMPKLIQDLQQQGYQYYDWNVSTGDGSDISKEQIIDTIKNSELDTNLVVLCHDSATKQSTLDALPAVIEYYQDLGYSFEALDRESWVCHHVVYTPEGDTTASGDTTSTSASTEGEGEGEAVGEGDQTGESTVQLDEDGDYV